MNTDHSTTMGFAAILKTLHSLGFKWQSIQVAELLRNFTSQMAIRGPWERRTYTVRVKRGVGPGRKKERKQNNIWKMNGCYAVWSLSQRVDVAPVTLLCWAEI